MLRRHFSDAQLAELTRRVDVAAPTGLDYYPLVAPGERFPVNDPELQPRLEPRPADDALFLQGARRPCVAERAGMHMFCGGGQGLEGVAKPRLAHSAGCCGVFGGLGLQLERTLLGITWVGF